METITLDKDIPVFYVEASSFPEGVMAAHERLHALVPFSANRRYFGLSRPEEGGEIQYKAAAEELYAGEGKEFNCKTMVIKKGKYIALQVKNYLEDVQSIQRAFDLLLAHPYLDPQGYCVEVYTFEKDVTCMIRLEA